MVLAADDRPFAYAQWLADFARRWLQPEVRSAAGVVDQVVLERFVAGLPAATATWVRCHRPSSLSAAVTLAEDHMVQCPAPPHGEKPEPAPRRKFPPRAASAAAAQGATFIPPNPSPHLFSQAPGSMTVRPKPHRSVGAAASWATGAASVRSGRWGRWSRWLGPLTSAPGLEGCVLHSGKVARE